MNSASKKIFLDIFDRPTRRSTNTMGSSSMRNPARSTRYFISI
jgi:hypothetical protein